LQVRHKIMRLSKVITILIIFSLLVGQSGVGHALAPRAAAKRKNAAKIFPQLFHKTNSAKNPGGPPPVGSDKDSLDPEDAELGTDANAEFIQGFNQRVIDELADCDEPAEKLISKAHHDGVRVFSMVALGVGFYDYNIGQVIRIVDAAYDCGVRRIILPLHEGYNKLYEYLSSGEGFVGMDITRVQNNDAIDCEILAAELRNNADDGILVMASGTWGTGKIPAVSRNNHSIPEIFSAELRGSDIQVRTFLMLEEADSDWEETAAGMKPVDETLATSVLRLKTLFDNARPLGKHSFGIDDLSEAPAISAMSCPRFAFGLQAPAINDVAESLMVFMQRNDGGGEREFTITGIPGGVEPVDVVAEDEHLLAIFACAP